MLEATRDDSSSASVTGGPFTSPEPPAAPAPASWTAGPAHTAPEALLCDLIAAQAARTPSAPAIRQWGNRLTYRGLMDAATALALRLRALGVGPEDRVGLCAGRTPLMPVAALGIMMAGGAYVPLDPAHPRRRLDEVLDDAGVTIVVTDARGHGLLAGCGRVLVEPEIGTGTGTVSEITAHAPAGTPSVTPAAAVSGAPATPASETGDTPPATGAVTETGPATATGTASGTGDASGRTGGTGDATAGTGAGETITGGGGDTRGGVRPGNAAYVLYTSGSTGRPKGVVVNHSSVVAFVTASAAHFGLDATCRSIAFSALGFDVSVLDMFTPLTAGGCVQLVPDEDRSDPGRLQRFLEAHDVTWGFIPPALLPLVDPAGLPHLRDLVTAGEPPGPEQVERWSARTRFHNWYGPTETTVCVVGTELSGTWERSLPIGFPLGGCRAHILDEDMRECPVGVPGELYIGGPQVSRGYLGLPGMTAGRFVPDPFSGTPGTRLYRTGDHVAWQPDGRIAFMGRLDRQVKIQGQRVEIGEVESVIRAHPGVTQAVVDAPGELVAYLAPLDAPDQAALREHCARRLPVYMLPTRVVRVPVLPLNSSGKVDLAALRALPRDAAHATGTDEAAGTVGTDSTDGVTRVTGASGDAGLAGIWARVLDAPAPADDDDFFERGGHSLRAMRLVSAIRAELGRDVSVEDVYAARTYGALSSGVEQAPPCGTGAGTALADTPGASDAPGTPGAEGPSLSPAQRRMWFVERLAPETPAHNIAMAERVRGPLDQDTLRGALEAVVARHEALRWRIASRDGVPHVSVAPPGEVPLPLDDLSAYPSPEVALERLLQREARTRFDLEAGPLVRARLLRLAGDDHVLAVTVHHIVFDGWSQDVFYRDLSAAYRGTDPGPAGAAFTDYVAWSRERSNGEAVDWWREHLRDAPMVLDLPRDAPRPPVQTFFGALLTAEVDSRVGALVRELALRMGVTPYPVLLAAFAELLSRLSGQDDLVVGTPYADRGHVAFESLVGMCVRVLPLRLSRDPDSSFEEHVARCRDELSRVVAHGEVPLERVVEALRVPRDLGRNPVTQVMFNMYNFAEPKLDLPGCVTEALAAGLPGALFDLTMYVSERGDGYALQLVYNPDLFSAARMEALLASYRHLLAGLLERPAEAARLAVLSEPEPPAELPVWDGPGPLETLHPEVVVEGAGRTLGYDGLVALRRRTTGALRAAGVEPGQAVAVLAARVPELPGLLLGVLASGARWVILDPAHPGPVLSRQAAAAGAVAVLRCPGTPALPGLPEIVLPEPAPAEASAETSAEAPAEVSARASAEAPAEASARASTGPSPAEAPAGTGRGYLSLTSGTTGDPKPVLTGEGPLAHFVAWYAATFAVTPGDRFALLSGLAHDPALRDLFVPLATGARLCMPEQDLLRDPARLAAWLREHRVGVLHLTPQLARMLCGTGAALPDVRLIATGGDRLTQADAARLRRLAPAARLVAFYGTTETPQAHAWHELPERPRESAEPVPAGRGIEGSELVVLGRHGRRAGVGELGEVVVRSANLATGYLDPELTRLRFTGGSFATGDLGRLNPDGTVTIAGRRDDQVKVRGFRVEPGEVEAALTAHPEVRAAAAVADRGEGRETVLHAYAVPRRPGLAPQRLLEHLRAVLPEHAVPAEVIVVPALPLTPNGKIDRAALRRPAPRQGDGAGGEVSGPTERAVAEVWRAVLGVPRVGAADNFFEIGGHSLAIAAVQARLGSALGREIPIVDLFRHPTIRALAAHLDGGGPTPGLDRAARRLAVRRDRLKDRSRKPS
ncbi:amino acid adenylation domain-containing protein [Streptosporangium sp. DT93]|uniref:amino acid adenylation domain-containing protein n=1 Tax=Streptosporangium sp. DT93 TaxID=3393428 RepID=UPI003CE82D9B